MGRILQALLGRRILLPWTDLFDAIPMNAWLGDREITADPPPRRSRGILNWVALIAAVLSTIQILPGPAVAEDSSPKSTLSPAGVASRVLVLSDFHFNPFLGLSRAEFADLQSAPLEQWPDRLESQPAAQIGLDAPWSLIRGCLEDARSQIPRPEFILLPGDFLSHWWNTYYDRLAARSRTNDPAAFDAFTYRAMEFLTHEVRRSFPSTPIFPVLGNEDSDCGDYKITPGSPFLQRVAELWAPLVGVGPTADTHRQTFLKTFPAAGYYAVPLPTAEPTLLIALNTVLWTPQYRNACGSDTQNPGEEQIRWLTSTLENLERSGGHAWLLMHVPPGIDDFGTHQAGGVAQPLWRPDWTARVVNLLQRHQARIHFSVAGHLHMDDFRILDAQSKIGGLIKVVPAVSPVYGNNPAYQILLRDDRRGTVTDYLTRLLPLRETGPTAHWQPEYEFRAGYPGAVLSPAFIHSLALGIAEPGRLQDAFLKRYSASGRPTPVSSRILSCAIWNLDPDNFGACAPTPTAVPKP